MSKYSNKLKQRAQEEGRQESQPKPSPSPMIVSIVPTAPFAPVQANHFSAGVICQKVDGIWCAAGITDRRFPKDIRTPGGTNKNALWESKEQTLARELGEELDLVLDPKDCCGLVHVVQKPSHTQYFFRVMKWSGTLRQGEFKDSDGEFLNVRWVPLVEFWARCFKNHREGFQKAVVAIAREHPDLTFRDQAADAGISHV